MYSTYSGLGALSQARLAAQTPAPKKEKNRTRRIHLTIYTTEDEFLRVRKAAAKAHMTMQAYILGKVLPPQPEPYVAPIFVPKKRK